MSSTRDASQVQTKTARNEQLPSLGEQTTRLAEDVRELGHIALSNASDAVQSAKERGSRSMEKGRERVDAARHSLEGYVAENPITSVLIAAGVGVAIGLVLRGRH